MKKIVPLIISALCLVGCNSNKNNQKLSPKEWLIDFIKSFDGTPNGFHDDFEWATFYTWQNSTGSTVMYKLSYYESYSAFGLSFRTYFGYSPVVGTVTFYWGDFANGDFRGAMYNSLSDPASHQVKLDNVILEEYPSFRYEGYTRIHYDEGAPLKNDSDLVAIWTYNAIKDAIGIFYEGMSTPEGNSERSDIVLW